jgi:translation initiation factor IF-2
MAKVKVHELAKELGVKSSEILDILKNKGIEVKSHMSVLEDGQVNDVKKALKAPAKSEEAPKTETAATEAKEHVKKKKSIIFVSNPNNSKMPGSAQIPRKPQRVDNKKSVDAPKPNENAKPKAAASVPVKETAKESVKEPAKEPVVIKETAKPAAKPEAKPENTAPVNTEVKIENKPENKIENKMESTTMPKQESPKNENDNAKRNAQPRRDGQAGGFSQNRNNGQGRDGQPRRDGQRRDGQAGGFNQNRNNGQGRDGQPRRDGQIGGFNQNRNNNGQGRDGQPRRDGQGFGGKNFDKGFGGKGFDKDFEGSRKDRDGQGFGGRGKNSAKNSGFVPDSPMKDAEKHRDEEKRRISQEKDKKNRKDFMYEDDENETKGGKGKNAGKNAGKSNGKLGNHAGKFIKPEKKPVEVVEEQIKTITIPETLTIKDLADKMKIQPSAIVKKLFMQGQIVTVNQEIDYETAENIAIDYDIICEKEVKVDVIEELLKEDEEKEEEMVTRPPVICVMGHVDHGKTSLLDAIRKTNVTDKEAGGITQHIGAYTVNINDQKITFLDTPGHEAFTAMRMRGANSTDIAILVVAADDGVMPQTVEAINHAKAAGIEIIVAVNKIDKPGANIERVKQELTEYGLIAEDWGGSTVFCPVSAKNGEGIENLLEMILLTAEVLELKANPNRRARGLVIEAELDKGRGPVATVLVQKGTLKVGDFVSAGAASGKVRAMIDDKGRRVKEAGPSTPVEILGLGDVPNAGEIFIAHENDKEAKYYAETFVAQNKEKLLEETKAKMSLDDLFSQIQAGNLKELNLIIKADVQGSVEAVKQSLMKLTNEEVVVKCIHGGVGAINESDVILASASNAIIIGFNVRPDAQAKATAEREGVDVRLYKVIYQAIEDIEAAMKGMLDPIFEEKIIGHAEVRQIFKASAVGNIAGSYILDGVFQRDCKVRITREGNQIYEGKLASLKRFKDDVKEVKAGFECGLVFEGFDSMQELDIVEAYIMVEVPR